MERRFSCLHACTSWHWRTCCKAPFSHQVQLAPQACPPAHLPSRLPHPCFHCCRRSDASWVKINAGQYGFYRVRYSLSNGTWAALAGAARWAGRERAAVQPVLLPPAPTFAASGLWVCFPAAPSPHINTAPRPIHTCPQGPRPSW